MEQHQHFRITQAPATADYKSIRDGRSPKPKIPERTDRASHASKLRQDLSRAMDEAEAEGRAEEREGITLEFSGEPDFDLIFDQLDRSPAQGIELANVRRSDGTTKATVYVAPGKIGFFFRLLEKFAKPIAEDGRSPRGRILFDSLAAIRRAAVSAFWTDTRPFPADAGNRLWWEVWVRSGKSSAEHEETFSRFAASVGDTPLQPGTGYVQFPERLVLLVRGSVNDWTEHPEVLNLIAELREAKSVPTDLVDLAPADQREWAEDAASRVSSPPTTAPAVCVLDTGVWRDHPLLTPSLAASDSHAVDGTWGTSDDRGHGTAVAGLALYGQELLELVEGRRRCQLAHRLESVKIFPPRGSNAPSNYGYVTQEGVAQAELSQPHRPRTVCLATTSDDRDQGYPSAWSAAIDAHSAGALDRHRRLYVVSAGNYREVVDGGYSYPSHNHELAGIEDPAQSWNAISVGACTDRVFIKDDAFFGWNPVAPSGGLSPTSRTSLMWEQAWPIKPDIVMEGGNWARDTATTISPCSDLELLTTAYDQRGRLFDTMRDTSAATAQAARACAQIQSRYPKLWPETVRALLVHSARWTERMQEEFPTSKQDQTKRLLRCYGYGIPDTDRALWSVENQVSLVFEGELQPFIEEGDSVKNNEMHIHSLPWPVTELQRLSHADVTVRITLSYFIEPSPGRRGWTNKFRYQSHGLRFKLRGPYEDEKAFHQRISRTFWADEESRPEGLGEPQNWVLGSAGLTNRGSIHCNWWKTSAAELAACGELAVFPVGGWWKERKHLGMANRGTRYALIVSIETPETSANLYTAIANQVAVATEITT